MNSGLNLLIVEITSRCNFHCSHCYLNAISKGSDISLQLVKKLTKSIRNMNPYVIAVTGGEPLLHPDVRKIIELFSATGSNVVLETNGSLLDDEMISFIKKHNVVLQLSLEGLEKTHDDIRMKGNYRLIMMLLRKIREQEISVGIHFTLSKQNMYEIEDILSEFKQYKKFLGVERLVPIGRGKISLLQTPEELKESLIYINSHDVACNEPLMVLINKKRQQMSQKNPDKIVGGCTAGVASCCISPEGEVFPCSKLRIKSGDLTNDSLETVWEKSPIFYKLRQRKTYIKGKCKTCEFLNICGGCRAVPFKVYDDWLEADPQCWKK